MIPIVSPPQHYNGTWTESPPTYQVKESPSQTLDPEDPRLVGSESGTKDPLPSGNSSETFADDLANVPISHQDVKSNDGKTIPPRGPSWIPLSRAFKQALPKPAHLPASTSTENVGNGQVTLSYVSCPWGPARPPLHWIGWRHITLPDNYVYFHNPTLRVTTDIDLRNPSKLDAVASYLRKGSIYESFFPYEGWEFLLIDSNAGKNRNLRPTIGGWANHAEKILTSASPSLPRPCEVSTAKTLSDDRTLVP